MPNLVIEAAQITNEKKNELIRGLTAAASEITGIPKSHYTVLIKEFPVENWGVGGEPLDEILKKVN